MNVHYSLLIIHYSIRNEVSVSLCALRGSVVKKTTETQSARRITEHSSRRKSVLSNDHTNECSLLITHYSLFNSQRCLCVTLCPPWLCGEKNHGDTECTKDHGAFIAKKISTE